MKKNILVLLGGGSTEHDISLVSGQYLSRSIDREIYNVTEVVIDKDFNWTTKEGKKASLDFNHDLLVDGDKTRISAVIPCIHGYPGETGDIQSFFEMIKLPYMGVGPESSRICFNKITTKLWLTQIGVENTPYLIAPKFDEANIKAVEDFFEEHKAVFIKASNQGSSVGCYSVERKEDIKNILKDAFNFSPFVLIEKTVNARELEVSAFEYDGEIHVTVPGEIACPSKFYTFEEKYNKASKTETHIVAKEVTADQIAKIKEMAKRSFELLKLRHLSRIDFFLCLDGTIYLNEINTFPGMTPISMFPKMMENYGVKFPDFVNQTLNRLTATK